MAQVNYYTVNVGDYIFHHNQDGGTDSGKVTKVFRHFVEVDFGDGTPRRVRMSKCIFQLEN